MTDTVASDTVVETTPTPANAVQLVGLRKEFGPVVAVAGVDLTIGDGEFFALLGPSGSGKTTVLRMIAGFEQPTAGAVLLGGRDVTHVAPYDRNVNTVFQDYALFPHMTVQENVEYGLRVKRFGKSERRRRAAEMLETVRLAGYGGRKPDQLSGGQRQRIALARALVNRPKVLLLDEPLGALDLKLREEMQVELKAIQHEVGITFVFVTHDQGEALSMSDRIAVFSHGRIEQVGAPPRDLRAADDGLRRRLRRHVQLAHRRAGQPRSSAATARSPYGRSGSGSPCSTALPRRRPGTTRPSPRARCGTCSTSAASAGSASPSTATRR